MKIEGVGHVVLKVRDLDRAAAFYAGVLGLKEVGRFPERMVFFSAGTNHHDLAVMAVGADAPSPSDKAVGLAHVALKIGDSLDLLREAKAVLEESLGLSSARSLQAAQRIRAELTGPAGLFADSADALREERDR